MNYYIDTSSLIKIYHKEVGSDEVIDIYKSKEKLYISELAKIEFISTISRKYRDKEIDSNVLEILKDKFQDDIDYRYEVLKFSSLVIEEAWHLMKDFAKNHYLRTLDSIQIAFFVTYCEPDDILLSSDKRMKQIAQLKGFNILMP